MNSGVNTNDPVLEAAFRTALLQQCGIILALFLVLLTAYLVLRGRHVSATATGPRPAAAEPAARRFLRISFGVLWIIDGLLQAQPQMAAGLPSQVIQPAATAGPLWVQDVANWGGSIWSFHPVQAAAATVWIQAGIGLWMIMAPSGWWSRFAGLGGAAWGLIVWVFGEAFGGIFAPGLSWLNGAPGSVTLYIVAGVLIALPGTAWDGRRLGRWLLGGIGLFWAGMAVLQAWPGRGYWQGGEDGTLVAMIDSMAGLNQPRPQSAMINGIGNFTSTHAVWVNLIAVVGLAASGLALAAGVTLLRDRPIVLRVAVPASIAFCLLAWVTIQDFGVPGGLGTDPNSMPPWALLVWAGYRAASVPSYSERSHPQLAPAKLAGQTQPGTGSFGTAGPRLEPIRAALSRTMAAATARTVTSVGAFAAVLVGVVPMAFSAANPNADPLIARAIAGPSMTVDRAAPDFQLVSQAGQPVTLASLRGKVTLLTFLDPKCTTDCPVVSELRAAGTLLGSSDAKVQLVAIAANPLYFSLSYTRALDAKEGLGAVPNWLFLTGSKTQLETAWGRYGIFVSHMEPGAASVMDDLVFVIDADGRIREEIRDNPGPGTISTRSSFAVLLSGAARQSLATS
jgi:cytochrome oxidase Cu insertion factor (SCO1/SenC/PrrC family)